MTLQSMLSLSWVWPLIHLALSPAFAACSLACSVTSWAYRTWRGLMQLPYTTALVIFAASELLAGDAVAFLSSKPSTRQQLLDHQGELLQYKHLVKDQARRIQALQMELANYRFEHDVVLNAHEQLMQEYEQLNQQLSQQQAAAVAAAAPAPGPPLSRASSTISQRQHSQEQLQELGGSGSAARCSTQGGVHDSLLSPVAEGDATQATDNWVGPSGSAAAAAASASAAVTTSGQVQASYRHLEGHPHTAGVTPAPQRGSRGGKGGAGAAAGESWTLLHVSVAVAALCVRWWLAHLHDPLQRKICWVVIWPGVWLYGSLLLRVLRGGHVLRTLLCCGCWALAGYIGHAMVQHSVSASSRGGLECTLQSVLSRAEAAASF